MTTEATIAERDERYRRVRAAMLTAGLDGLVVAGKGHWWTGRGYLRYLTDFHLWAHDGLLLVPLEAEPALVLSSHAVAGRIGKHGWVEDTRGDVYLAPELATAVRERKLEHGRLGIAGRRYIIGAGVEEELRSALPGVEFVDADELLDRVRMIRSALEIRQIRELWELSKAAMEHFVTIVGPGKTERALAAECSRVALEGGARDLLVFIGEQPAVDVPRDEPLRCDDLVRFHMEMSGPSGHWSEITVTCAYRQPTDGEQRLMDSELRAYAAIREAARPGATLPELGELFERTLREDGWTLGQTAPHFDFHGQGMDTIERPWFAAEPPWGASQSWPLEAGMVFSYHPSRAVTPSPGWPTGINEDILITQTGAERLSGDWDLRWRMM